MGRPQDSERNSICISLKFKMKENLLKKQFSSGYWLHRSYQSKKKIDLFQIYARTKPGKGRNCIY